MNTRTTTVIASIVVIALIAAGIGFAYTSILTTSDNTIGEEDIVIIPKAGDSEIYSNSTGAIKYNTSRAPNTATTTDDSDFIAGFGMIPVNNNAGYAITSIDNLLIENHGNKVKTVNSITVTISNNTGMCTQLKEGGSYAGHVLTMKIGDNSIASTSANCTIGTNTITFSFTNLNISLSDNNAPADKSVPFSLVISDTDSESTDATSHADVFDTSTKQYPHSEKFGNTTTTGETAYKFDMQFTAEATE